jgi:hypothetical protein
MLMLRVEYCRTVLQRRAPLNGPMGAQSVDVGQDGVPDGHGGPFPSSAHEQAAEARGEVDTCLPVGRLA